MRTDDPLADAGRVAERGDRDRGSVARDDRVGMARGERAEHVGLQAEILGQRLDDQLGRAPAGRCTRVAGRRASAAAAGVGVNRAGVGVADQRTRTRKRSFVGEPVRECQRERRLDALLGTSAVAHDQADAAAAERVLAADLRAHQPGAEDRDVRALSVAGARCVAGLPHESVVRHRRRRLRLAASVMRAEHVSGSRAAQALMLGACRRSHVC